MRRQPSQKNQGVLKPEALTQIRQLQILDFLLIGNVLSDRALKAIPGVEHIPILYTQIASGHWRARYRELADGEAARLTKELRRYVPPRYIELGPSADAVSIYHEAVHTRRAMLGRSMTPAAAEPSAIRTERFAATLDQNAAYIQFA
jgi:hypothetical protein